MYEMWEFKIMISGLKFRKNGWRFRKEAPWAWFGRFEENVRWSLQARFRNYFCLCISLLLFSSWPIKEDHVGTGGPRRTIDHWWPTDGHDNRHHRSVMVDTFRNLGERNVKKTIHWSLILKRESTIDNLLVKLKSKTVLTKKPPRSPLKRKLKKPRKLLKSPRRNKKPPRRPISSLVSHISESYIGKYHCYFGRL